MRRLHGWEPREVTEHFYDDSGRVTHTVTSRESEWEADEVATLLASRAQSIGSHGISMEQATDPANAGRFRPRITRDYALEELHRQQKAWREARPHDNHDALLWRLELIPPDTDSDD